MNLHLYSLRRLSDPDQPLVPAEGWAKRRRKVITSTVLDYSPRQRRRDRLISMLKPGDVIITPSLHNFASSASDLLKVLLGLEARRAGIVFVKEQLELRPGS